MLRPAMTWHRLVEPTCVAAQCWYLIDIHQLLSRYWQYTIYCKSWVSGPHWMLLWPHEFKALHTGHLTHLLLLSSWHWCSLKWIQNGSARMDSPTFTASGSLIAINGAKQSSATIPSFACCLSATSSAHRLNMLIEDIFKIYFFRDVWGRHGGQPTDCILDDVWHFSLNSIL